jgi:ATP-dependent Clp protease adaptor protein ClpS
MLNDDYTPMEFVVEILQVVFRLPITDSTRLMWQIHTEGKAKCGVFSHDVAVTKVRQVTTAATQSGHPLKCIIAVEEGQL